MKIHATPALKRELDRPPGMTQLGHAPGSKVKLEGPKVHHDDHGKDASVPAKGKKFVNPEDHWEVVYNSVPSADTEKRLGSEFDPRCAKYRMTTHVKVNELDH